MSKIKSLIDDDIKENIDHSAICVKFAMMSKQIEEYQKALDETTSKKIDLENIIKEVREYINDNVMVYAFNDKKFPHWDFNDDNINDILEILDKVEE